MIELTLAPDCEKRAPCNPFPTEFQQGWPLLHQLRTYEALEQTELVVNSYNTGTGKTKAALLHLLRQRDEGRYVNTLFIAPTNELLRQHEKDIRGFVERNGLELEVLRVDASVVANVESLERQGSRLHALLQDPALGLGKTTHRNYVLVINPDIFYYALYCRYGRLDWRNLFKDFLGKFDYLVVDELHYYNAKQVANFLFFLMVVREYGYFDTGGRACVLTATPNEAVRTYLERLEVGVAYIERGNEPADSADLPPAPSLAPVCLRLLARGGVVAGGMETVVAGECREIADRLGEGEQGAIVSGALWRINRIWETLQRTGVGPRCARLTGPEDEAARVRAREADLILATPTVDLGYNFERGEKARQNVDFLYLDALYGDELLQRLGRAGRVLGKSETDVPSSVTAICPDELVEALRPCAGCTLTRKELSRIVWDTLQPRHDLYSYIQRGAIGEAFLPILRLGQMTEREDQERLRDLFQRVRDVFAPSSQREYWRLRAEIGSFLDQEPLFQDWPATEKAQVERAVDPFVKANGRDYTPAERGKIREAARRPGPMRERVLEWIDQQRTSYEVKRALYTFRESFEGPLALVYDPRGLLSSQPVRVYDLFHVVASYDAIWYRDAADWRHITEQQPPPKAEAVAFCELRAFRPAEGRLRLRYRYDSGQTRQEWQDRFTWGPTALRGIQVEAEGTPLPPQVVQALADRYIVCYARDPNGDGGGRFVALSKHGDVRIDRMDVELEGEGTREYRAALGTAAFFAYAEVGWMERADAKKRAKDGGPMFA